ncbi:MAG: hypothetical protein HQL88_09275 [Magnetococcales bacterium]|nr:hypothetical protein [Magnetococcales bacterium]
MPGDFASFWNGLRSSKETEHSGFAIRAGVETNDVDPVFSVRFMKSMPRRMILVENGDKANINSLNWRALAVLPVRFPSLPDQRGIIAHSDDCMLVEAKRLRFLCQRKQDALAGLRQSVLQKLFISQLTNQKAAT